MPSVLGAKVVAPMCQLVLLCLLPLLCAAKVPDAQLSCDPWEVEQDSGLSLLQRRGEQRIEASSQRTEAERAKTQERFLNELHAERRNTGGRCDDGPGDRRGGECAAENCKRCLGNGAVLTFSPDQAGGYTKCEYYPHIRGATSVFCGEKFGNNT